MDNDLVSKRRAERCTTHSHACDCREYAHAQEIERLRAEVEGLRARIEGAAVAWAGVAQNGLWYAGQDWRDSAHVKLHLSGFGDAEDQKSIKTCRVALVPLND